MIKLSNPRPLLSTGLPNGNPQAILFCPFPCRTFIVYIGVPQSWKSVWFDICNRVLGQRGMFPVLYPDRRHQCSLYLFIYRTCWLLYRTITRGAIDIQISKIQTWIFSAWFTELGELESHISLASCGIVGYFEIFWARWVPFGPLLPTWYFCDYLSMSSPVVLTWGSFQLWNVNLEITGNSIMLEVGTGLTLCFPFFFLFSEPLRMWLCPVIIS